MKKVFLVMIGVAFFLGAKAQDCPGLSNYCAQQIAKFDAAYFSETCFDPKGPHVDFLSSCEHGYRRHQIEVQGFEINGQVVIFEFYPSTIQEQAQDAAREYAHLLFAKELSEDCLFMVRRGYVEGFIHGFDCGRIYNRN